MQTDLSETNLSNADLRAAFSHVNLKGANLQNARLASKWEYVDLSYANLSHAKINWLKVSDLRTINLSHSKLTGVDIGIFLNQETIYIPIGLETVDLKQTNLRNSDLSKLDGVVCDETILTLMDIKMQQLQKVEQQREQNWKHYYQELKENWFKGDIVNIAAAPLTDLDILKNSPSAQAWDDFLREKRKQELLACEWSLEEIEQSNVLDDCPISVYLDIEGADLAGMNLQYYNLENAKLSNTNLSGANLSHANLSRAVLNLANLQGADLSHANLLWAQLEFANIQATHLTNAIFYCTKLNGIDFSGFNLQGSQFHGADFMCAKFVHTDLRDADLSNANLTSTEFRHTKLRGANLQNALLWGNTWEDVDLSYADLSNAEFTFCGCFSPPQIRDMRTINLSHCILTGVDLSFFLNRDATHMPIGLETVNLKQADLRNSLLSKLRGILSDEAILELMHIQGVQQRTKEQQQRRKE